MKKTGFFWIAYSDLMTSLFFIMLVLFVVTVSFLQYEKKATEEQLDKIEEIQTSVQQLPEDYFSYQPQYKRFKLNEQIQFVRGSTYINPKYHEYLRDVGHSITNLVDSLYANDKFKDLEIKYLIVIEGMSSRDSYSRNFELSYERALALYKFWNANNIKFDPKICEIQIAGSGTDGVREYSGIDEFKNQQFLIHIVPKIGEITERDEK